LQIYSISNINIILLPPNSLPKSCGQSWEWSSESLAPSAMEFYVCSRKMLLATYLPKNLFRRPAKWEDSSLQLN